MDKFKELESLICYMIKSAGSGHYASSMSALEIMYPLFYEYNLKPDQFILSKGHAAPALYAILYDKGYLTAKQIDSFRQEGGLAGHPEIETKGVLCSSGSLGMGISKALGLAHANPDKTYHVLVGDGELQEGQNWEALLYLQRNDIKNIIIHVDYNRNQYSGPALNSMFEYWRVPNVPQLIFHSTSWTKSNSYLCEKQSNELIDAYSVALYSEMKKNKNIVVLDADLEHCFGLTRIKNKFPDRFIECGISEQHMASMANGLALAGKVPFCHTFGAFYRRCIDQIYNNCCDNLKIIYVGGLIGKQKHNIGKSHDDNDVWNILDSVGCPCFTVYDAEDIPNAFKLISKLTTSLFVELDNETEC
jgi:transketolase